VPVASRRWPRRQPAGRPPGSPTSRPRLGRAPAQLLQRALRLGHDNDEEAEWLDASAVKNQLLRMDPAFNEKELGYASFSDFADSFKFVEVDATQRTRRLRLRRR